jgi:transposase
MVKTAPQPEANTLYGLQTVPGMGQRLSLGLWSAMPAMARCPRGQDVVSSCRLVPCAQASAGKRSGTSGTQSGPASLTWACSAAALLCLRTHPAGHKSLAR